MSDDEPTVAPDPQPNPHHDELPDLGAFSISLAVEDLTRSRDFYERLGFQVFGGDPEMNYLMLRNGRSTIGLFQGHFDGHVLTFNPGLDADAQMVEGFTDVRDLQATAEAAGLELQERAEEGDGPAHFTLLDPDGNAILVDQFFPRPD